MFIYILINCIELIYQLTKNTWIYNFAGHLWLILRFVLIVLHEAQQIPVNASCIWTTTPSHPCVTHLLLIGCSSPMLYHPGLWLALLSCQSNGVNLSQSASRFVRVGGASALPLHHVCLLVVANNLQPAALTSPVRRSLTRWRFPAAVFWKCVRGWSRVDAERSDRKLRAGGRMVLRVSLPALWRLGLQSGLQPRLRLNFVSQRRVALKSCLFHKDGGEGDTVN